jgi:hypothetical protein
VTLPPGYDPSVGVDTFDVTSTYVGTQVSTTTCNPWTTVERMIECYGDEYCRAQNIDDFIAMASDILWRLSGKKLNGVCERTVRPCPPSRCDGRGRGQWFWYDPWRRSWWYAYPDAYINFIAYGGRYAGCHCGECHIETLRLPGPIQQVISITIDGQVLGPNAFDIAANRRELIRCDGQEWPTGQDFCRDPHVVVTPEQCPPPAPVVPELSWKERALAKLGTLTLPPLANCTTSAVADCASAPEWAREYLTRLPICPPEIACDGVISGAPCDWPDWANRYVRENGLAVLRGTANRACSRCNQGTCCCDSPTPVPANQFTPCAVANPPVGQPAPYGANACARGECNCGPVGVALNTTCSLSLDDCADCPQWVQDALCDGPTDVSCWPDWARNYVADGVLSGSVCGSFTGLGPSASTPAHGPTGRFIDLDPTECYTSTVEDLSQSYDNPAWEVTYLHGNPIPIGGTIAATRLAYELSLSFCGDSKCRLPYTVQSVARQGVSINFEAVAELLKQGLTGISEIDMWLLSVNPYGNTAPSRLVRPDALKRNRRLAR